MEQFLQNIKTDLALKHSTDILLRIRKVLLSLNEITNEIAVEDTLDYIYLNFVLENSIFQDEHFK